MNRKILKQFFEYHQDGCLVRTKDLGRGKIGQKVFGTKNSEGYMLVTFQRKSYRIHRLIFLLVRGTQPNAIDHIDRDKTNNRIENLRAVTVSENHCNKIEQRNNRSGVKGLSWDRAKNYWKGSIQINGKRISVGHSKDRAKVERLLKQKREELHGKYATHG
jgi:hypothetical protein